MALDSFPSTSNLRLFKLLLVVGLVLKISSPVASAGLRLQACDDDFRQMSNWLCSRAYEKTPCYKFYFDVEDWKGGLL
jgi:hypothetical protein